MRIKRPDDWHVHLRQGSALPAYTRAHAKSFGRVLAMPNTTPPLTKPEELHDYKKAAEEAAPGLVVLTAFRLMPGMGASEIEALRAAGTLAGKYYPDGATTNSDGGLVSWRQIEEALAAMEKADMVLCVHAEEPSSPVLLREEAFLPTFSAIREAFPRLRMILEHVSSAAGVRLVNEHPGPTAATVTVQHLYFTLDDLIGGQLNPHLFCKPVVKFKEDRQAIQQQILDANPRFFFGSDSAPHVKLAKESDSCPAGAYSAPMALAALAGWFDNADAMDRFEPFVCEFGRQFYRLEPNPGYVTLERRPWRVPLISEDCVPLMAGDTLAWTVIQE